MNKIEQLFTEAWYQQKSWVLILFPLELFYRAIMQIRALLYRLNVFKSYHPTVPVVIVGNLTVGGTGKTPVVIELVNYLSKHGWKPGVISRGYGGKEQPSPIVVTDNSTALECGDEPILIQRNSQAMVVVDRIRSRGASYLVDNGCNIIVADDGLQHLALKRDYELVVIDGERGFGNKHLLPVGPLREAISRLKRCDFILTNGDNNRSPVNLRSDNFIVEADKLIELSSKNSLPVSFLNAREVHAVAGIGNPQRFFSLLEKLGARVIKHSFPDHHQFKLSDIPNDKRSLIVTEKDAVKLEKFNLQDCFYLSIKAKLPDSFWQHFSVFLEKYPQKKSNQGEIK